MERIKINIPASIISETEIDVRISDINYGNHVGNDAFVSMIHEARVQWLQKNNFTELDIAGIGLIMSDIACEFKNESFYGDKIFIEMSAAEISKVSFNLYYRLTTERDETIVVLARAKTGMVCYDYKTHKIAAVPVELMKLLTL
ncbi:MAG: esterase [Ferruginibacter sp.]|nr:esterase [Ferruginibacter sp.]